MGWDNRSSEVPTGGSLWDNTSPAVSLPALSPPALSALSPPLANSIVSGVSAWEPPAVSAIPAIPAVDPGPSWGELSALLTDSRAAAGASFDAAAVQLPAPALAPVPQLSFTDPQGIESGAGSGIDAIFALFENIMSAAPAPTNAPWGRPSAEAPNQPSRAPWGRRSW